MTRHLQLSMALALLGLFVLLPACGEDGDDDETPGTGDTDADTDTDSDGDSDADSDGDSDTDSDGDSDGDADSDTDSDTDADSDADSDSDSDSDTDAAACEMAGRSLGQLVDTRCIAFPDTMVFAPGDILVIAQDATPAEFVACYPGFPSVADTNWQGGGAYFTAGNVHYLNASDDAFDINGGLPVFDGAETFDLRDDVCAGGSGHGNSGAGATATGNIDDGTTYPVPGPENYNLTRNTPVGEASAAGSWTITQDGGTNAAVSSPGEFVDLTATASIPVISEENHGTAGCEFVEIACPVGSGGDSDADADSDSDSDTDTDSDSDADTDTDADADTDTDSDADTDTDTDSDSDSDGSSVYLYFADMYSSPTAITGWMMGSLTALAGSPFSVPTYTKNGMATPDGKFLYMVSANSDQIVGMEINPTSGAPTALSGSPFSSAVRWDITVSSDGAYLYTTDTSSAGGNLAIFAIDGTTGALTAVPSSPYTVGNNLGFPVDARDGAFLYVPAKDTDELFAFSVDGTTGALTALDPATYVMGDLPYYSAAHPSGQFIYIGTNDGLYGFAVDASTGALSATPSSPYGGTTNYSYVAVHPNGNWLWADDGGDSIATYSVNSTTGELTASGSAVTLPDGHQFFRMSPNGWFLVTIDHGSPADFIGIHDVNASNGTFTEQSTSPYDSGVAAYGQAVMAVVPPQ